MKGPVCHLCRPGPVRFSISSALEIYYNVKKETPDLKDKTGRILTSDTDKANILNEHFTSVFTNEPLNNVPTPLAYDGEKMSDLYNITEKQASWH
jgi:hypothetical protein